MLSLNLRSTAMNTRFNGVVNLVGVEDSEDCKQRLIEKRREEQARAILEELRRKRQNELNEYFLSLVRNKRT